METKDLLSILFLGEAYEKFKILSTIYLLTMCAWITNIIMNNLGYYYNPEIKIKTNHVIDFLLSANAVLLLGIFVFISCLVFICLPILLHFISFGLSRLIPALLSLLFIVIPRIILLKFKKLKRIPVLRLGHLLNYGQMIYIKNNIIYKGKQFSFFKKMTQDLITKGDRIINGSCNFTVALLSTVIVFYLYQIYIVLPITYVILKYFMWYYILNACTIIWLDNKKDYLIEIMLKAK